MFGSHLSIAGGMVNALKEAERLGLDTVQVFTKNQQQWNAPPLKPDDVQAWLDKLAELGWTHRTVSHASYLINLASPDDELWRKSIDLMIVEIERCDTLSIPWLVHHPGAYTRSDRDAGLRRIADAYAHLFERTPDSPTVMCLENTVGAGSVLGRPFEELAELRALISERTAAPHRVAFCFDTCHAHAGGYDLSSRAAGERALDEFDRVCGLEHLRVVHLNDSMGEAGSRRDRHTHIGAGTIGKGPTARSLRDSGFAAVVNRPELGGVPMVLETPKESTEAGTPMDVINVRRLTRLMDQGPEV